MSFYFFIFEKKLIKPKIVEGPVNEPVNSTLASTLGPGNANSSGGGLGTVDLLVEAGCFAKMINNIFNIKRS
jgi:hypothetical protein